MELTIKEVSEKFNIPSHTLRYYEKEGLVPVIARNKNGNRVYCDTDLEWIGLICCMRKTGMSIAYIKKYVELVKKGEETVIERKQLLQNQKEIIENEILKYEGLLKVVNRKLNYYDLMK